MDSPVEIVILRRSPPHLSQIPLFRQSGHPTRNPLPNLSIEALVLRMELIRIPIRVQVPTGERQRRRRIVVEFRAHPADSFHVLPALQGHAPVVELDAVSDVGVSAKDENRGCGVDCADCVEDRGPFVSE